MTQQIAQGLAGLNAVYLGIIGLLSMASPATAGAVYQLDTLSPAAAALTRIVGGLMAGSALVLALFAYRPEAHPWLATALLAGSVLNVAADLAACGAGEIRPRQVAGSLVFQAALGVALGVYLLQRRSSKG